MQILSSNIQELRKRGLDSTHAQSNRFSQDELLMLREDSADEKSIQGMRSRICPKNAA